MVAWLRTCGLAEFKQRLGDDGKLLDDGGVRGHLRHGGGGAEPQALRAGFDAVVEKPREADQPLGPAHVFLQELHHVGAAGDVFGGRVVAAGLGAEGERGGEVARAFEGEGVHGSTSPHRSRSRAPRPGWPRRCGRRRRSGTGCRSSSRGFPAPSRHGPR